MSHDLQRYRAIRDGSSVKHVQRLNNEMAPIQTQARATERLYNDDERIEHRGRDSGAALARRRRLKSH